MKYSISHKRELTKLEIEFLTYLFEREKSEWTNLLENLKVIARCGCGKCPTIMFGKTFDSEIQKGNLIIDYLGKGQNGELVGVSIFGTDQMPTELDFYSIDGGSDITEIPKIDTLKSMNENLT
ncbi:conserved hypothetical protein [Tenacibaculum maritimum]|uniref:hypothetical protein n=1 Tax=Tenacibaculum maritimum TaxID=107401 RepID=UPI0012E692E5|nr:hypothetical protein [Tenacibaculum maritimum]CAA0237838.1 conserved hypothetical protein [Tenacibaculum maritimum]